MKCDRGAAPVAGPAPVGTRAGATAGATAGGARHCRDRGHRHDDRVRLLGHTPVCGGFETDRCTSCQLVAGDKPEPESDREPDRD
jgi:hypothetical protein